MYHHNHIHIIYISRTYIIYMICTYLMYRYIQNMRLSGSFQLFEAGEDVVGQGLLPFGREAQLVLDLGVEVAGLREGILHLTLRTRVVVVVVVVVVVSSK